MSPSSASTPLRPIPADDDAELGQVGTDRVDQRRALPNEQLPRPMQHQHRLLVLRLDRHEAHRRRVTASQIARHRLRRSCCA